MQVFLQALSEIQSDLPWEHIFVGLFVIVFSQALLLLFDFIFQSLIKGVKDKRKLLSMRKFFVYLFNVSVFLLFLKIIQVDMKVALGATGLLTLAIGFAARTPISNLISGIFLVFERPFVVGDIIEVSGFMGEVVSRNLLSLTMRSLDNRMVRIPNEMVIGNTVSNISYFPIRRLDIKYLLSKNDSLTRLEEIFKGVARNHSLALDEPLPYFYVTEFKENCTEIMFRVWSSSEDFLTFQSEFPKDIHRAVKAAGMESIKQSITISDPIRLDKND